jgi:hypothetical protein
MPWLAAAIAFPAIIGLGVGVVLLLRRHYTQELRRIRQPAATPQPREPRPVQGITVYLFKGADPVAFLEAEEGDGVEFYLRVHPSLDRPLDLMPGDRDDYDIAVRRAADLDRVEVQERGDGWSTFRLGRDRYHNLGPNLSYVIVDQDGQAELGEPVTGTVNA